MQHIFCVHSLITNITVYDTVVSLANQGEKVIVVTNRCDTFPLISGVKIVDFSKYTFKTLKSFSSLFLLYKLIKDTKKVINNTEFVLYIPTSFDIVYQIFQKNKFCKSYYYIEEGSISYEKLESLDKMLNADMIKNKGKHWLGINTVHFIHDSVRFNGTLSISDRAFYWNNKTKLVNNPNHYFDIYLSTQNNYNNYIVFGYMQQDTQELKKIVDVIFKKGKFQSNKEVAVKFHPRANILCLEKVLEMKEYINNKYEGTIVLDSDFCIEKSLFQNNSCLYCVNDKSSLIIYSIINGGAAYLCKIVENDVVINTYDSLVTYSHELTSLYI